MYTCEYDFTISSQNREGIVKYAEEVIPYNREITEEQYTEALREFYNQTENTVMKDQVDFKGSINIWGFVLHGNLYFVYIMHPGLNGEQFYYGFKPNYNPYLKQQ
jgi:FPC/CPF motif-containing protein YcgG